MGLAAVENQTPFVLENIFLADEEGRPLFVPVVKATYAIHPHKGLTLAEKQLPVNPGGQFWGDPDASSSESAPAVARIVSASQAARSAPGPPCSTVSAAVTDSTRSVSSLITVR